ncbi:MAG: type III secretion system chaperone [Victivallales bacterium]|nr:type III secretion system chaperone [Victivallales bacterium]
MSTSGIGRLARAIGYPDEIPSGVSTYALKVDDGEIVVAEMDGRLLLQAILAPCGENDSLLETLAGYAAGRILREEAVLAYDPQSDSVMLWQPAPAEADAMALREFFERFAASWDWWRARVQEILSPKPTFPEVMIRP